MKSHDLLQRFTYTPREDDKRRGLEKAQVHNGTWCASDTKRAAVILSDDCNEWEFGDVYLDYVDIVEEKVKQRGKKKATIEEAVIVEKPGKLDLSRYLNDIVGCCLGGKIEKKKARELIVSCKEKQKEYREKLKELTPKERKALDFYGPVLINAEDMSVISENEALEMSYGVGAETKETCFNTKFLEEALRFALCSGEDDVWFYYKSAVDPIIFKSGRLYSLVVPIRIK